VSTLTLVYKLLLSSFFVAPFASVYTTEQILSFFVEARTPGRYKKETLSREMLLKTTGRAIHVNVFSENLLLQNI